MSVHPYRQQAPETVEEEYRSLRLLIRRYAPAGKTIPIISGEWGYSTQYPAFAGLKDAAARDEQQAKWLARQFLTNIANDIALSIWYDWRDDGTDPKEPEHHFGLVRHEYHPGRDPVYDPKPAYTAMKTMTEQLGGFRYHARLWGDFQSERLQLFARGKTAKVSGWTFDRPDHFTSPFIPAEVGPLKVISHLSVALPSIDANATKPADFVRESFGAKLPVTDGPCYVGSGLPDPLLQLVVAWPRLPLEVFVDPQQPGVVSVEGTNPLAEPVDFFWLPLGHEGLEDHSRRKLMPGERQVVSIPTLPTRDLQPQTGGMVVAFSHSKRAVQLIQSTKFVSTKPLGIEVLPRGIDFVPIRITNPSLEPFRGSLRFERFDYTALRGPRALSAGSWPKAITLAACDVVIEKGQLEAVVRLKVPADFSFSSVISTRFDDSAGLPVHFQGGHGEPPRLSVDYSGAADFTVIQDGDARVASEGEIDGAQPAVGASVSETPSIRLRYRFGTGWRFVHLAWKTDERRSIASEAENYGAPNPRAFGLWLHGDGKGCQARVRFKDKTGQAFQPDGPKIDWKGWRYVTFPMQTTPEKPLAHWGGANDGVIHYPIEWDSIFLLDNVSRQPVEGEIYLSAPTLIY